MIGYDTWQSRFGGRRDVIGSTVTINGRPFTVIGVAPRGFHGTEVFYRPEIWVPMMMQAEIEVGSSWLNTRTTQNVMVVARLRPATSREPRRSGDRRGGRAAEQGASAQRRRCSSG